MVSVSHCVLMQMCGAVWHFEWGWGEREREREREMRERERERKQEWGRRIMPLMTREMKRERGGEFVSE